MSAPYYRYSIRAAGKGDPQKPRLRHGQVVKHYRKGHVVSIATKVIFGKVQEVKRLLEAFPVSKAFKISFTERNNLTLRQHSWGLARKSNGFSKDIKRLEAHLYLTLGYHHSVKEHFGLRQESKDTRGKWVQRTPAMAAGITDHIWTTTELLICLVS